MHRASCGWREEICVDSGHCDSLTSLSRIVRSDLFVYAHHLASRSRLSVRAVQNVEFELSAETMIIVKPTQGRYQSCANNFGTPQA